MTLPTGAVRALSQSYWSPRLYQQMPRTGKPWPAMVRRLVVRASSRAGPSPTGRPRLEVSDFHRPVVQNVAMSRPTVTVLSGGLGGARLARAWSPRASTTDRASSRTWATTSRSTGCSYAPTPTPCCTRSRAASTRTGAGVFAMTRSPRTVSFRGSTSVSVTARFRRRAQSCWVVVCPSARPCAASPRSSACARRSRRSPTRRCERS